MKNKLLKCLAVLFTCTAISAVGVACGGIESISSSSTDESTASSEVLSTDESEATSEDVSTEESEVSVGASEETSEETSEEVSVEVSEEVSEESEVSVGASEETSEEVSVENSEETSEENSDVTSGDSSDEGQDEVPEGNLLTAPLTTSSTGGYAGLVDTLIYDHKVSMILNIESSGIVQFNARGPVGNNEWPEGLVIRFDGANGISVSARKHDTIIYGNTAYAKQAYIFGNDILFEYQTTNVTIADVEYIRTQIWVQGEALAFTAAEKGVVGLETGVNALYRKVSDFLENPNTENNINTSPFWFSTYNTGATVKELRIDGTSCAMPAEPEAPDGHEVSFNTGDKALITAPVTVVGNEKSDAYQVVGKYSNEEYVAVTFNGEAISKGAFCLNITGTASGWTGGLVLRLSQDGVEIRVGGPNAAELAKLAIYPYDGGIKATAYTIVYKLTYVKTGNLMTGVKVDVWFGEADATLTKCVMMNAGENATIDGSTLVVSAKAFPIADMMTPGDITVVSLGALNGDCDWTVSKVEILTSAPNA